MAGELVNFGIYAGSPMTVGLSPTMMEVFFAFALVAPVDDRKNRLWPSCLLIGTFQHCSRNVRL